MSKFLGVFALVPATFLLTLSFFVLFTLRKTENGLKVFGYIITVLLWIAAALVLSSGIYAILTGRTPAMPMIHQMMKGQM